MWDQAKFTSQYATRAQQIVTFNQGSRWVKQGISINPCRWSLMWAGSVFGADISIFPDGSVNVSHSGVEVGQGINTKVAQCTAMSLGVPLSCITVVDASTAVQPNASGTGGSVTNGLNSAAVLKACKHLKDRLAPIKSTLGPTATWQQIVAQAVTSNVDLHARGWEDAPSGPFGPQQYEVYGVAVTQVEVDLLTGMIQIPRVDILFDAGLSMNPAIDIGQVEGAFVQGLGFHTTEETQYKSDGTLISDGTWEYKVFSSKDIPIDYRITLLKNQPNPYGIMRAKAAGEPPLSLGCSVLHAIRHAIAAGQQQVHNSPGYFPLNSPATPENIEQTFLPQVADLLLNP
jgi:xanthine dehydrogenase/oxidase